MLSAAATRTDEDGNPVATFAMGDAPSTIRADATYGTVSSLGTLDVGINPGTFAHSASEVRVSLEAKGETVTATASLVTWDVYTDAGGSSLRNVSSFPAGRAAIFFRPGPGVVVSSNPVLTDLAGRAVVAFSRTTATVSHMEATANFMTGSAEASVVVSDDGGDSVSNQEEIRQGSDPDSADSIPPARVSAENVTLTVAAGASQTLTLAAEGGASAPLTITIKGTSPLGSFSNVYPSGSEESLSLRRFHEYLQPGFFDDDEEPDTDPE